MSFRQFNAMLPMLLHISAHQASQVIHPSEGQHVLVVVRRGHVTIAAVDPIHMSAAICTQGFALHPSQGSYTIEIPRTKEADYVVIRYRVLPATADWDLHGPLSTISEIKIHYMLDDLFLKTEGREAFDEEEEMIIQSRTRMMLERILFIFLYESGTRLEDKSTARTIEDTLSYMNEHYMLKLTLPMLARRAEMSAGHFTVLFKRHTGTTMTAYLRSLRIDKAKQMFEQTQLTAKEIAHRAGFPDYFHFSRVFKKHVGCSPAAFQQGLSKI